MNHSHRMTLVQPRGSEASASSVFEALSSQFASARISSALGLVGRIGAGGYTALATTVDFIAVSDDSARTAAAMAAATVGAAEAHLARWVEVSPGHRRTVAL